MKLFRNWILRKAEKFHIEDASQYSIAKSSRAGNSIGTVSTMGSELNSNGMNFKVYKASGGTIIETNQYDRRTDRHNSGLYIVTDDKDLGKEIGKIITMESLKS